MAVYTKINTEEISSHLSKYNIGSLVDFKEIIDGIDNSNFILQSSQGKFILTIFESRIDKTLLPFFINLKLHLAQKGISCPRPIFDNKGSIISDIKEKKSVIVSFLNGKTIQKNITHNHCFEVGKVLANLHLSAFDFSMKRKNDLGINGWKPLFSKFESSIENYQKDLGKEILESINFLQKQWIFDLPSAASHLDLFPDNVFFDAEGKVSGVIDFYFAANDTLIYDFAITITAWCFDENNNFSEEKFSELLRGYEIVRKFSDAEKKFLNIALIGAAMRFLLTRLNDMFFTPKNSLVKIKNPQDYLTRLRFFRAKL
jgi:homoserine kinase type II